MKSLLIALAALSVVASVPVNGKDWAHKDFSKVIIYGVGGSSCGNWTEARKNPSSVDANINLTWVQGYLSAATTFVPADFSRTDVAGINAFMDKYCSENPLKDMYFGAVALGAELRIKESQ